MRRRWPLGAAAALALSWAMALAIGAMAVSAGGAHLWTALHACARLGATVLALPALLALALAGSIIGLGLWHGLRQAALSVRALRVADRHAVPAPPQADALAGRLGARLTVVGLPEELAYCAGLLRPRVVLSLALIEALGPPPLEAVLTHEAAHARRRDPLRQVLAHAAARALWFAPLAAALAARQRLRIELAADRAAQRRVGRRALVEALLVLHRPRRRAEAPALAGGATLLDRRIDALAHGTPAPGLALPRGSVLSSLVGLGLAALLVAAVATAPPVGPDPLVPMPMDGAGLANMTIACVVHAAAIGAAWIGLQRLLGRRADRRA